MNSRERVRRAILFQRPDKIPIDLPEKYGSDFLYVGVLPHPTFQSQTKWEDEFGCIWERISLEDKTMGQVKFHPLFSYAKLKNFPFPDFKKIERYREAQRLISQNKKERFILADIPFSIIHRLQYLRGFQEALTDPYLYPKELSILLDKLTDIAMDSLQNLAKMGIDGIISCDDWGFENQPMVSRKIFRKFFKPRYKRIYSFAHQKNILTFLHSCGHIIELLEDFIEVGLDVIQIDQQENMGLEKLGQLFGGRICFFSPVDIQKTMVKGNVFEVRNYAQCLIDTFGKFNGGFIAKWYGSPEAVGHTQEKIEAMCQAFIEYGSQFYRNTHSYS